MPLRVILNWRNSVSLFFLGVVLGTWGDYCHVISATDGYPEAHLGFLGMAFWVPLLFGSATWMIGTIHPISDGMLGAPVRRRGAATNRAVFLGGLAFTALYTVSGFIPLETGGPRDAAIAFAAALLWFFFDRTWQGLFQAFVTAICGLAVEITLVSSGAFFYWPGSNNLFGVPSWLGWLYVAASVCVGNVGRRLALTHPDAGLRTPPSLSRDPAA